MRKNARMNVRLNFSLQPSLCLNRAREMGERVAMRNDAVELFSLVLI